MSDRVYLDHHACAPVVSAARSAVSEALADPGNPSSVHAEGRRASARVEAARASFAKAVVARPADLLFTSCGTEACDLAVHGLAHLATRVVATEVDHPAVSAAVDALERAGTPVVRRTVPSGQPPDSLGLQLGDLAIVPWVQSEVGTVFPVEAYALEARVAGALLVVDGCQAPGKVAVDLGAVGATAVAFSGSKFGAPEGVGALHVAPSVGLRPRLLGGMQERGRRAGTQAVPAIAGLGAAADLLGERLDAMAAVARLRDSLEAGLVELGGVPLGAGPRVATVTCVAFPGRSASRLVAAFDLEGVAVSSGPACSMGAADGSAAVRSMYPSRPELALSSLRFSLGPETTAWDIARALGVARLVLLKRVGGRS